MWVTKKKKKTFNTNFPEVRGGFKFMPYKITLEKKKSFPGVLRNNNTQGDSPMHSYPGLVGSWDLFASDSSRLLVQDNSAGAEVPRIFSFAFSWLRNLYKVSEMHIFYVRWASPNQKGKLLSLYFCCLMYKTAPSLLREVAFIREDSINSGSQWCPKEIADILYFLSMS